ncbi:MAG: DUF1015 family protein [Eggerthellaceae bacterium]|jgi:uncharacterized protein (DUF1015 family)|nr:DUF1015 family protein [Eggerthellaceae bacterium]MDR2721743.1 DUF1015 family protein [Coriobacteriaceae bacterium]
MADVIPFSCVRPREDKVLEVAALPYDVYNLEEARVEIEKHPDSFLRIDMAEATMDSPVQEHDERIYEKARDLLLEAIAQAIYIADDEPHYFFYRLTALNGRTQTGVVACSSIDDYLENRIKKHEKTKPAKEIDRIRHINTCCAHTGPIFLAYRSEGTIESVMEKTCATPALYNFIADDGIGHTIWRVDNKQDTETIRRTFEKTSALYIADGHHRAASAVKAGLLRREERATNEASEGGSDNASGKPLASDHFLSIIFPSNQLVIYDYNRTVADLNGLSLEELLARIQKCFVVSKPQTEPIKPEDKGIFGMYVNGLWYKLTVKAEYTSTDPVDGLDVSILQDRLLGPILGVDDPRTDKRIDFVGGVRGLDELERRVATDMKIAFALFPPSIEELFAVADAGQLMPPKSTWFEPKPRSGIFIHQI